MFKKNRKKILAERKRRVLVNNTHHFKNCSITRIIGGAQRHEKMINCLGPEASDFKIKLD